MKKTPTDLRPYFVCAVLFFCTLILFSRAVPHDFLAWTIPITSRKTAMCRQAQLGRNSLGVHFDRCWQLASVHLAFAYARLADLRKQPARPSRDKFFFARAQRRARVFCVAKTHRRVLAERRERRAVRVASAARRIRRVDRRTQGRLERIFFLPDASGVCPLG